jgi:hypothetical protein
VTIYGRFGDPVTLLRFGTLADVTVMEKHQPDYRDRWHIAHGSYLVVLHEDDGSKALTHECYLRADGGAPEIGAAMARFQVDVDERIWCALYADGGARDAHHERCQLAKASGPHGTLACKECGRARWMHATRHDTCGQFRWVEFADGSINNDKMKTIRSIPGVDLSIAVSASTLLNGNLSPGDIGEHRARFSALVNAAMNRYADRAVAP